MINAPNVKGMQVTFVGRFDENVSHWLFFNAPIIVTSTVFRCCSYAILLCICFIQTVVKPKERGAGWKGEPGLCKTWENAIKVESFSTKHAGNGKKNIK